MRTPQLNANSQRRNKFALGINERNDIVFPLIGFLISFLYNGVCACKFLDSIGPLRDPPPLKPQIPLLSILSHPLSNRRNRSRIRKGGIETTRSHQDLFKDLRAKKFEKDSVDGKVYAKRAGKAMRRIVERVKRYEDP